MFKRYLDLRRILERKSLFLFGPRQTGKSTYLKNHFPEALHINLLRSSEFKDFLNINNHLENIVDYQIKNTTNKIIIIDEVQKLPQILDDVHDLIEKNKSLRFILTGSSARKLKRSGVNLLGGRATWINFYPLTFSELLSIKSDKEAYNLWIHGLLIGKLPSILNSQEPHEDLKDYVGLYLKEEVQAEGLTRSIENFSRFLDFVALMNAEQINFTSLASDAQITPSLARDYFDIVFDTLIGHKLSAFEATKKRKAMTTAKFYLFDCGITNSILGRTELSAKTPEYGKLLEQAIFLEIKAYLDYNQIDKKLEYWRSTSKFEVDFVIYKNISEITAIEVKASSAPTTKDYKGLLAFNEEYPHTKKIVVCNSTRPILTKDNIQILPIEVFLKKLWQGEIV